MTVPPDRITTGPEYARWYRHFLAQGETPDDAARRAYAVARDAVAKRSRSTNIALAVVLAVLVLVAAGGVLVAVFVPLPFPVAGGGGSRPAQQIASVAPSPTATPGYTPAPDDFLLPIKVTEKHCFGSQGCNVIFRVDPFYDGPPVSADEEWLVTYEVSGAVDGPQIGSFIMRGEEYFDVDGLVIVPSATTAIAAKVSEVTPN
jgi:hypothetical protein